MQVICGGVWHNFILAILALLLLQSNLIPTTLTTLRLYIPPDCPGWVITNVNPSSLSDLIQPGFTLVQINDIKLDDLSAGTWPLIEKEDPSFNSNHPTPGFCVTKQEWQASNDSCCDNINYELTVSQAPACFKPISSNLTMTPSQGCLLASTTLQNSQCNDDTSCDANSQCVIMTQPVDVTYQWTRLYINQKEGELSNLDPCDRTRMVLHLGDPREIPYLVSVSDWGPNWFWLPWDLPRYLLSFLSYLQAFSFALGILNIIPVFYLDGQFLLQIFLPSLYGWVREDIPKLKEKVIRQLKNWLLALRNQHPSYDRIHQEMELTQYPNSRFASSFPVLDIGGYHRHSTPTPDWIHSSISIILWSSTSLLTLSIGLSLLALL